MKTKILIGALLSLILIQTNVFANRTYHNVYADALIAKIINLESLESKTFAEDLSKTIGTLNVDHPLIPMLNSLGNCAMVLVYLTYRPSYFSWLRDVAITNPIEARAQLLQISAYCYGVHDTLK